MPSLDAEPEVLPHALVFWYAFTALSDRRPVTDGGQPLPIQYSEILSYLDVNAMRGDADLVFDVAYYVAVLDRYYIDFVAKKKAAAARKAQQRRHKK